MDCLQEHIAVRRAEPDVRFFLSDDLDLTPEGRNRAADVEPGDAARLDDPGDVFIRNAPEKQPVADAEAVPENLKISGKDTPIDKNDKDCGTQKDNRCLVRSGSACLRKNEL